MQDFWFHNPTKVVFGRNKVEQIGEETKTYGHRVLLVYGRESIHRSGLHKRMQGILERAGLTVLEHGGVKANPVLSHVRQGIKACRDNNIEVVLGVGGGSVIDAAKAIAAGTLLETDIWELFRNGQKPANALPVFTVLTIAGTGSEMNGGVIITNEETRQKFSLGAPCLYPKVSILDPTLTFSVSKEQTACGLADAFSHIVEPYFNGSETSTVVQDALAEGLMQALIEISGRLLGNLRDYHARADMMWASTIAFNGLLGAGRGSIAYENHFIAHSLGGLFDVPHGAAISVIMPQWMSVKSKWEANLKKLSRFSEVVMGVRGATGDKEMVAQGIVRLRDWLASMGCPTRLYDLGIKRKDLPAIVSNVVPFIKPGAPGGYDEASIIEILELCL